MQPPHRPSVDGERDGEREREGSNKALFSANDIRRRKEINRLQRASDIVTTLATTDSWSTLYCFCPMVAAIADTYGISFRFVAETPRRLYELVAGTVTVDRSRNYYLPTLHYKYLNTHPVVSSSSSSPASSLKYFLQMSPIVSSILSHDWDALFPTSRLLKPPWCLQGSASPFRESKMVSGSD